jgi:hypothetical protein
VSAKLARSWFSSVLASFVIDAPFAGQYSLDFTAPWTKDNTPATAHADLTLAGG